MGFVGTLEHSHSSLEIVMRKLLFLEFRNKGQCSQPSQCASYKLITIKFQSLKSDLIVDEMKHNFFSGLFPFTVRTTLLNWCNLVSISKNIVFYLFLVARIY